MRQVSRLALCACGLFGAAAAVGLSFASPDPTPTEIFEKKAVLGKAEFAGEKEIDARWPEGYGSMTVIDAGQLKR